MILYIMLTINDILAKKKHREEKRHEVFNILLERCCKKIEQADNMKILYCVFEVPEFLFGYPLYNLNECVGYLLQELTKRGFQVQYIFPHTIIISWFVTVAPRIQNNQSKKALTHTQATPYMSPKPGKQKKKSNVKFTLNL